MRDSIPVTPSKTKRIEYIDAMRGFTMFLVVFMHVGHSCFDIADIADFHSIMKSVRMPMFFFISGFVLYKAGVVWNTSYLVSFFKKKIPVQLISPFLFYAVYMHAHDIGFIDGILDGSKAGYWFTFVLFEYFVFYAVVRFLVRNSWADVILLLLGVACSHSHGHQLRKQYPFPTMFLNFLVSCIGIISFIL